MSEVSSFDVSKRAREESRNFNHSSYQTAYTGRLLISESPLQVLPSLAKKIGLNEALVLQQIHYWISNELNKNYIDGRKWVYNTYEDWNEQFPFWCKRTIKTTISSLESKKLLISGVFNKLSSDRTKWYTIDYRILESLDVGTCGKPCPIDSANVAPSDSANVAPSDSANVALCITRDYIPETISDINNKKINKKSFDNEFEQFWSICPKKVEKQKSLQIFNKLLSEDYGNFEKIMAARRAQNVVIEFYGTEQRFIKGPDSWLRNRRFEDEVLTQEQLHEQRNRSIQAEASSPSRMSKADLQFNINAQFREQSERRERDLRAKLADLVSRRGGDISQYLEGTSNPFDF